MANRLASTPPRVVFGARRRYLRLDAASRAGVAAVAVRWQAKQRQAERKLRLAITEWAGTRPIRNASRHRDEARTRATRLASMLTTAKLIAAAAFQRRESRGAHFRSDHPLPDASLAKRSFLTLEQAETIARAATETIAPARVRRAGLVRTALHA
jgi:succinate dehydrogenase/fumarate reductase flavoprotein subunit